MNQSVGIGYRHNLGYKTNTPYTEPLERQQGYTKPDLTAPQHFLVIIGSALAAACAQRPIHQLEKFYFLSDVPGESSRIGVSEKQAEFLRALFHTRWWAGPPLWRGTLSGAFSLGVFIYLRNRFQMERKKSIYGFTAGAATGIVYAVACHPYDVLRATAEAPNGPKNFSGPMDVLWTALTKKRSVLLGLYRGFSTMAPAYAMQYGVQFGLYNYLCYDIYRGPLALFFYCHLAAFSGQVVLFPFLRLRQQLQVVNSRVQLKRLGYRFLIREIHRRYGLSKVYDGFFSSKPILNAIPPALLLMFYDVSSRRYTEYLNPEKKTRANPSQMLGSVRLPSYVTSPKPYEFENSSPLAVQLKG